jgi:mannose-1-phosphate guanylyltransferase / mannose-6-phosphate isomerase
MKVIVLSGGGGTRLWPLSKDSFPKQFLRFGSNSSLLQKTIQRLEKIHFVDLILISTNEASLGLVKEHLEEIAAKKTHILTEPCRKNTAPAIGFAMRYLEEVFSTTPAEPILVIPSDHLIDPEAIFVQSLDEMRKVVLENKIITFGIRPTKPETGYGYIQIGKRYDSFSYEAAQFVEKPNLELAQKYVKDSHYYWNSGMFLFSSSTFWEELNTHCPELFSLLNGSYKDIKNRFSQMPNISIDFALMEKSKKILVCPLAVSWSDIGSWDSLYDVLEKDENQNVKIGSVLDIDTKNSFIFGNKRLISTVGIEDLLVIETEEAIFVGKKGESQKVKKIVEELLSKRKKEEPSSFFQILDRGENHSISKIHLHPFQEITYEVKENFGEQWICLNVGIEVNKQTLSPHKTLPAQMGKYAISNKTDQSADLIILRFDKKSATI